MTTLTAAQLRAERAQAARLAVCQDCGAPTVWSGRGRPPLRCPTHRAAADADSRRAADERRAPARKHDPRQRKRPGRGRQGRRVDQTTTGYRDVYRPGHPNAGKNGQIGEHRFVMSEHLGRALLPGETVHHRNGVRDDNDIDNLELRVGAHPKGLTVEEAVAWAEEILARYC
jgi:hypothetical protein